MRKLIAGLVFSLLLTGTVKAQVRVLAGGSGGVVLNNATVCVKTGVEVPFSRYEVNVLNDFCPYENHKGLGYGKSDILSSTGIVWLKNNFGATFGAENSSYSVTSVSKSGTLLKGGLIKKLYIGDLPSRVSIGYIQQIRNGVVNGVESSHLKGGYVTIDSRLTCNTRACLRTVFDFDIGHTLAQGNPICDGTYGNGSQVGFLPCPRRSAIGGGFQFSIVADIHKKVRPADEYNLF